MEELLLKIYPADLLGTMKTFKDTLEVCVPYKCSLRSPNMYALNSSSMCIIMVYVYAFTLFSSSYFSLRLCHSCETVGIAVCFFSFAEVRSKGHSQQNTYPQFIASDF